MREQDDSFREGVVALVPQMRAFARFLARDAARADDLVQDAVVRAFERRETWTDGTDLRAWLLRILRNLFLDQERRHRTERRSLAAMPAPAEDAHPSVQAGRDALRDLDAAIATLPAAQREALILVAALEMSLADVAAVIGVPEGTVKARVSRARTALAKVYVRRS